MQSKEQIAGQKFPRIVLVTELKTHGEEMMAYTGFGDSFEARQTRPLAAFRRWLVGLIVGSPDSTTAMGAEPATPRKLAGPDPKDLRAQGYMADLDMEVMI